MCCVVCKKSNGLTVKHKKYFMKIRRNECELLMQKLLSQSKLSELVGWSESTGRSWIKTFKDIIPHVNKGTSFYYTEESVRILTYIKKLNEMGYSRREVKHIFESFGVPSKDSDFEKNLERYTSALTFSFKPQEKEDIPSQTDITIPFLKVMSNGQPYPASSIVDQLAQYFHLTDVQRSQTYERGKDSIFVTRVRGVRYSLKKENYIDEVSKAVYQITKAGLGLLNDSEEDIKEEVEELEAVIDPITIVEEKLEEIRCDLVDTIINRLQKMHWRKLEYIVIELLTAMGYGDGKVTGKTNDGGLDGIIKEDKLGLDNIYVQAKRWENTVGRPEVMSFSGALDAKGARKGIFITTSNFTKGAKEYVERLESKKIILIGGEKLARLMIENDIGVSIRKKFIVKEIDFSYFEGE